MTVTTTLKVGWCPGALRPMASGDGYIVRIKPRAGLLDLDRAEALGNLSLRHGNGLIDLTGRANLQIRGATTESLPALTLALRDLGLLDPSADAEAIRNVVVSPLAGMDDSARCDIRPIVTAIENILVRDETLHALPAKWSIVVDDGGALSLSGVGADIRFEALADDVMQLGLANDSHRALCAPDETALLVAALGRLALDQPEPQRMQALVQAHGAKALFARVGLRPESSETPVRLPARAADVLAWHDGRSLPFFGVAPPFASLGAENLVRLIAAARASHARDLRLTPWRVLLVTGIKRKHAASFAEMIENAGFMTTPTDSRLGVSACSGAPACHRATTPTRADAALLVRLAGGTTWSTDLIHVSGCSKGCANGAPAPWTLVGRDGRYDVVRRGRAGDEPVARGLCIEEAATWISHDPSTRTQ